MSAIALLLISALCGYVLRRDGHSWARAIWGGLIVFGLLLLATVSLLRLGQHLDQPWMISWAAWLGVGLCGWALWRKGASA